LHPGGVVLSAILFGVLETGANAMQREANVSAVLVYVIQAFILLFVLVGTAVSRHWVKRKI
jgi:simple sugar transport system permease protein